MLKSIIKQFTPRFALSLYHRGLSFLGALWYGFPSRKLMVIGVTGTKGKTSTVHFIVKILEHAGYKVGAISGLYFKIGAEERSNILKMTMPGRFFIQHELRCMVDAGCTHAVVEVTSEGIAQHRARYIDFDTAVFTNIASEHLEAHGGFEQYVAAKQKLFASLAGSCRIKKIKGKMRKMAKMIIVNGDDARAEYFLEFAADRKFCCHLGTHASDEEISVCEHLIAEHTETRREQTVFHLKGIVFVVHLPGAFNAANALLALAVGVAEGLTLGEMAKTLAKIKNLPGRMERITSLVGFDVFVDYAHTPDSLDAVYRALQLPVAAGDHRKHRLICVLGAAGGGRDRWKRNVLGAVAGAWGDEIVVTNEDPYDENPAAIVEEVAKGAENASGGYIRYFGEDGMHVPSFRVVPRIHRILDRREAIRKALNLARPGDVVAITGKGSERVMAVAGGKKVPWDDREVVKEELARLS